MRKDIKERIEMIKRGEVPDGYKQSEVGIFPNSFIIVSLDKLVAFQNGINADKEKFGSGTKIISVSDILNTVPITYDSIIEEIDIDDEVLERYSVTYGDILFQRSSENVEDAGKSNVYLDDKKTATFGGFVIRGKRISDYNPILINEILKLGYVRKQIMRLAAGVQHINIGQESLKSIMFAVPNKSNESRIQSLIEFQDNNITLHKKLLYEKKQQKKSLMQNLLTGKKRLKGFSSDWKKVKLGDFIIEVSEKTTVSNEYEILSVTKNGIFKQRDHFNKQIASDDNTGYKILRKGNLVFSTMNLWMGSLDVLEKFDIGIVSPSYKIFEFNDELMCSDFGKYYMKSSYMIWLYNINSEQGASIVRKNLDLNSLLDTHVRIPETKEQKAIAQILSTADKEIELLEKQLELIKLEKKAIMQLLLTGIIRVNDN